MEIESEDCLAHYQNQILQLKQQICILCACLGAVMAPTVQHEVGAAMKNLRHRGSVVAVPAVCYIHYKRLGAMAAMATSKYKEDV